MAQHRVIRTGAAPAALGPYSQAVALPTGDSSLIFVAGQIPVDPATGELVGGPVEDQVRRVLDNIRAILEAAGSGLDRVVQTTVYLANLGDFDACNAAYAEFFPDRPPARATVEVRRLPRGVAVEIEAVAYA